MYIILHVCCANWTLKPIWDCIPGYQCFLHIPVEYAAKYSTVFQMNRKKHMINDIFTCITIRLKDTMAWILSVGALQPIMKIGFVPADKGQRLKSDLLDQFIHVWHYLVKIVAFILALFRLPKSISQSSNNSCCFYEKLPSIFLVSCSPEPKALSTLQCLQSTLGVIQYCLYIQCEV